MAGLKRHLEATVERRRQAIALGDMAARDVAILCWCNRCGHHAALAAAALAGRLGPHVPVPDIGARMRCTGCGARDVATRPDWPSPGARRPDGEPIGHR